MNNKRLRTGITTGSCAAMAAYGAACVLSGKEAPGLLTIETPQGKELSLPPVKCCYDNELKAGICSVRKDAGDDPDVTDGVEIVAMLQLYEPEGEGHIEPLEPGTNDIFLTVGEGIGVVQAEGLNQPVGNYAVNSVPREMIGKSIRMGISSRKPLLLSLSITGGEEIAKKTFNSRFGIEGGLSVIGTTGEVRPMSNEALKDTIFLEIKQRAVLGDQTLVLCPGNQGEEYWNKLDGSIAPVQCSNFIGDALDEAMEYSFQKIILAGHLGKLVKLAGGIFNTHSHVADGRKEIIMAHSALCGAGTESLRCMTSQVSVDGCLMILKEEGLLEQVMESLKEAALSNVKKRLGKEIDVELYWFSNVWKPEGGFRENEIPENSGQGETVRETRRDKIHSAPRKGIFYAISLGPGDPENITLRALHLMQENRHFFCPRKSGRMRSLEIAAGVLDLENKVLHPLEISMRRQEDIRKKEYAEAAEKIAAVLKQGENALMLNLGDVSVYATASYVMERVAEMGYEVRMVSGVTSFTEACARAGIPLVLGAEDLHVFGSGDEESIEQSLSLPGTKVFMKNKGIQEALFAKIIASGKKAYVFENLGFSNERIYELGKDTERAMPEDSERKQYFTTVIVFDGK